MTRRIAWLGVLFCMVLLCLFIARRVPPGEGGLMPSGVLLLAVAALALRRRTTPRTRRPA